MTGTAQVHDISGKSRPPQHRMDGTARPRALPQRKPHLGEPTRGRASAPPAPSNSHHGIRKHPIVYTHHDLLSSSTPWTLVTCNILNHLVFGSHIAYIASQISTLSNNTMKLRKYMPLGSPSLDPAATPLKRNWKKILHLNRRNKDRLWVALYKYTGPGAKGGEDLKYQRPNPRQDPDKITPVIDPEDRK